MIRKMSPIQITGAYRAIRELSGIVLPYRSARAVAALKRRLEEEFEVVESQDISLAEKHGGKKTSGGYHFDDDESMQAYMKEFDEIMNAEDEIKLPVVDLSKHTSILRVSPNTVEALDGIIIFEKEESDG